MLIKAQFDFLRYIYDSEGTRYGQLTEKAKLYFTIWSAGLAFMFNFVLHDRKVGLENHAAGLLSIFCMVALSAALFFSVWALSIRTYEGVTNIETQKFVILERSVESFYLERTADFLVAYTRNKKQNDRLAAALKISLLCGVIGLLCFGGTALSTLVIEYRW
jgi:hypothetical protein